MKRSILTGLAGLAVVTVALGQTVPVFDNSLISIYPPGVPPQIDATTFFNSSVFIDNTFNSLFTVPYETANTVNYTNLGVLASLDGFRFDTFNTQTALYTNAANFYNAGSATLNCGGTNYGGWFSTNNLAFFIVPGGAECLVWATNIINGGTIDMGMDSLLSLQGQNVNLKGGLLNMEGFETGDLFGTSGMFDGYWGLGQTPYNYNPVANFGPNFALASGPYWVTNRYYSALKMDLSSLATAIMNPITNAVTIISTDGTNTQYGIGLTYQIVYLQTADDKNISHNVYFPGLSVVEWAWPSTNIITGVVQTNHLYLEDSLIGITNLVLMTNGVAPPNTGYQMTYIPTNYFLFQGGLSFLGPPATNSLPPGAIGPNTNNFTSAFTAYEALLEPTTVIVSDVAGQTYSNMPGRIEVTATNQLDLRSSRIAGLNYVRLTATNNFTSDANTRILSAVADYNLGVTNATMTVSNLLAPTCPRLNGYVDLYSTGWTNIPGPVTNLTSAGGTNVYYYTNSYFITMVDSYLASSSPSEVQNLTLHAPSNVVISDVLNVLSNITIDAYNVTIATNGPGAQTPVGQLIFPPGQALGLNAFPRLRTLTNYGVISVQNNGAAFGAAAQPLWDFINYGSVQAWGCSIWATNFVDSGLVDAGPGPINLTATSAVLSNGVFNAPDNSIVLSAGSLFISNQVLNAGNLTIEATNSLTDGGPANGNVWTAGVLGFSLPILPPIASLLGTTITDTAPAWDSVSCQWAGQDLGPVAAGYGNTNAPLGRLILDGGTPGGSFVVNALPGATNALYVDYLEFRDSMTNFDSSGDLANLSFGPGMKIYYAQLIINGLSWAEKLNGKNGGGLNWVPAYAGAFSSTNMVYPNGTTNRLNLALVTSCDLDSNGNGIPNCLDPAPVFVPSEVNLTAVLTNMSLTTVRSNAVVLSWNSIPYATNFVQVKPSLTGNWQPLTNVLSGPAGGRQRVVVPVPTGAGAGFYRVQVN